MGYIRLVHWNSEEAKERSGRIEAAGYEVVWELPSRAGFFKDLVAKPPIALVVDLSRLPSQGRDLALGIRHKKATRGIPLVFVDGDEAKVDKIKKILPDAVYTKWRGIKVAIKKASEKSSKEPVVPDSIFAGYEGKSLSQKLGIKEGMTVALIDGLDGFEKVLGKVPEGVKFKKNLRGKNDLMVWFVRSQKELIQRIDKMVEPADKSPLWIAWPKKASKMGSDLTQAIVRKTGLDAGLVDYKICSIDKTWSGLIFRKRK